MHHNRHLYHRSYSRHSSNLRGVDEPTVVYDYKYRYSRDDDDSRNFVGGADDGDDDLRQLSGGNYTYTASVTIRVTPHDDFLVSWGVLWGAFVGLSIFAAYQAVQEHRTLVSRRQNDDAETVMIGGVVGDGESVSTADETRALFRRLLLLAMAMRVVMMPIQIWSDPVWCQFFADTLPEMVFASAWTTLVSFLVQLVGLATGLGTNTSPSIVIQATAYVVYAVLLVTQIWNAVATVLLYALMCCIYAALFGTGAYFCPVLLSLLKPSLMTTHYRALTVRLVVSSAVIMVVFLAHTIGYARLVVAPPIQVQWWWKYGALELVPSAIFLAIMSPRSNKARRQNPNAPTPPPEGHTPPLKSGFRRVDSTGSAASGGGGSAVSAAYASSVRSTAGMHRSGGSGSAPPPPWAPSSHTPPPPPPPPMPPAGQSNEGTGLLRGAGGYGATAMNASPSTSTTREPHLSTSTS